MRNTYLLGNWKMLGDTLQINALLQQLIKNVIVNTPVPIIAVFPPAPYLTQVQALLQDSPIALGAQTVSEFKPGAYTGEVAADMLVDIGCRYVLIGHSERRILFNENNAKIHDKFYAALEKGLVPVLCVGESLEEWQSGQTFSVLEQQLAAVFTDKGSVGSFILAYEPVWAIGTGKVASPEQAQAVHFFLRQMLVKKGLDADNIPIVYGGSVKAQNFAALLAMPDIDGGLVGGASWQAADFIEMSRIAKKVSMN